MGMTLPPLPWLLGGASGLIALLAGYLFWKSRTAAAAPAQPVQPALPPAPVVPTPVTPPTPTPPVAGAWTPITLSASGPTMTIGPGTYRISLAVPASAGPPPATMASTLQQAMQSLAWTGISVYMPGQTFPTDWPDSDPTELRIQATLPVGVGPLPLPLQPGQGGGVWYSAAPAATAVAPVTPSQVAQAVMTPVAVMMPVATLPPPVGTMHLVLPPRPAAPAPVIHLMPIKLAGPAPAPAPVIRLMPVSPPSTVPYATYLAAEKAAQQAQAQYQACEAMLNAVHMQMGLTPPPPPTPTSIFGIPLPRPAPPPPPVSPQSLLQAMFGGVASQPAPAPSLIPSGAPSSASLSLNIG